MKNLITAILLLFTVGLSAQTDRFTSLAEAFVIDWNRNNSITYNLNLAEFIRGGETFRDFADKPDTLAQIVKDRGVTKTSHPSFYTGVYAGYIYAEIIGYSGWDTVSTASKNMWNTYITNNNDNIGRIGKINPYILGWYSNNANLNYYGEIVGGAYETGLWITQGEKVLIGTITVTQPQADWFEQFAITLTIGPNNLVSFDNYHYFIYNIQ
jgi:hypothetical protein